MTRKNKFLNRYFSKKFHRIKIHIINLLHIKMVFTVHLFYAKKVGKVKRIIDK